MELKETIELMNSDDFKDRMRAEYWQTKIRYDKLHDMLVKYESGMIDFRPNCSLDLLTRQSLFMHLYLKVLKIRAEIEGVIL